MSTTNDQALTPALVARAQTGDATAITAIYAHYAPHLYRFILSRVRDGSAAEDLLQDTLLKMVEGLPQFQERGVSIRAWLYRIASCRVIDWYRAERRRRVEPLEFARPLAEASWPDGENTEADRQAQQRALAAAIAQLSERQAVVIRLRFGAELPLAVVAARLGVTLETVKALQHRGLARLRCQLIQHGSYHAA